MVPVLGGLPQFVISPDPKFWGLPQENHLQMVGFESLFLHDARFESLLSSGHGEGETRPDASEQVSPDWQEIPAGGTPKLRQIIEHGFLFGYPIRSWDDDHDNQQQPTATSFFATSFYLCESHQGRLFVGEVTLRNVSYISQSISTSSERWLPCPMSTKLFIPIYSHIWW